MLPSRTERSRADPTKVAMFMSVANLATLSVSSYSSSSSSTNFCALTPLEQHPRFGDNLHGMCLGYSLQQLEGFNIENRLSWHVLSYHPHPSSPFCRAAITNTPFACVCVCVFPQLLSWICGR